MWEIGSEIKLSEILTLEILSLGTLIVLFLTVVILALQTRALKKGTKVQAYQNVLSNYITCISRDEGGEPLYRIYFEDRRVKDDDLYLFSALINTFEMLYVQKKQGIISKKEWDPWKEYFIELLKRKNEYRDMWEVLKCKNLYHKGLTKIINEELK